MEEMTQQEFWKEFIDNVEMVRDFRAVCEEITKYIEKYGTQEEPEFKAAKEVVLNSYLGNEDYESCQRLIHPFKSAGTQEEIAKLKKNISTILGFTNNFADNCDICYDVLRTNGMLAFDLPFPYVLDTKIDGLEFVTELLRYFHSMKDFQKCAFLKTMRDELKKEIANYKRRQ